MNGSLIAIIVILVLCLVLAGIIYYAYCRIREKLRDTSRMLFGTDSMIEGMKQREAEVEMTPKSVSSATNLYMPSIMRDFPEFHYDEMKSRAENVLRRCSARSGSSTSSPVSKIWAMVRLYSEKRLS